jgi:hypothetical protein
MFISEPKLFFIGIISLPLETLDTIVTNIIQLERTTKIANSKAEPFCNLKGSANLLLLIRNSRSILKDKVCFDTYYHHTPYQMQINETLTKV